MHACSSQCHQRLRNRQADAACRCPVSSEGTLPARLLEYSFPISLSDETGTAGPLFLTSAVAESLLRVRPQDFAKMTDMERTRLKVITFL